MMTPIVLVGGDPHVMDDAGKLHRQTRFFCKSTDCTISSEGVLTAFPRMELAHNADPVYLMDTKALFLFDADTNTALPQ